VRPEAEDTVKKELVLDAVAAAEDIEADEEQVMHEIGHLAENSERSPEELAETMRQNGTYALLEEEISRQRALDYLVDNAVPTPMPDEVQAADDEVPVEAGGGPAETEESERKEEG
jgi:trigger factor